MMLICTSVVLLFIPHAKWHNVHRAEIQSTAPHLIEHFLGNSPKITNQLFFENLFGHFKVKTDISLKSVT